MAAPAPERSTDPDRAELEMLRRARDGDEDALGALLDGYQRRLYAVCYRMAPDAEAAADLTQDAFVNIIRGLDSFDGRSKLSTWMIRIAMNTCLTRLRAERYRRHAPLAGEGDLGGATGPRGDALGREHGAESAVEQGERFREVSAGLMRVKPEHRAILVLRDVQGLEYEHIADVLGVAVGTVKSRLFRARAALRMQIEADETETE